MQGPKYETGRQSLNSLQSLTRSKSSSVVAMKNVVHMALPPSSLSNVMAGVRLELDQKINRYYSPLAGVLLGYQDPRLTATTGHILHDQPYIHLDVSATFYVFTPKVGDMVHGVVNKRSGGHLGCLLYDTFNVSLLAGVEKVTLGEHVELEVTRVSYNYNSMPLIEGKLIRWGEMCDTESIKRPREEDMDENLAKRLKTEDISVDEISETKQKKSKKKKKQREFSNGIDDEKNDSGVGDVNSLEENSQELVHVLDSEKDSSRSKKKKKKHRESYNGVDDHVKEVGHEQLKPDDNDSEHTVSSTSKKKKKKSKIT